MTEYPADRGQRTSDPTSRLRLAALTAVIIGVLLLAAAAFVLSYSGIHHIALQAGVSPKLARFYPGIFDAMLVIACAAVLALRGAGWLTRVYVWLCLIVLLAAVATGDAVHAMGDTLPRQPARAGVAITPWALVLLSFGLLLAMLRYLRRVRATGRATARKPAQVPAGPGPAAPGAAAPGAAARGAPASRAAVTPVPRGGLDALLEPRTGEPPALPTTDHPTPAAEHPTSAGAQPPPASAPPVAAGEGAAATTAPEGRYSADAYYGADTPEGTEEFYEHEDYEDYAEEFPAAGAEHGDEHGEDAGQPGSGEAGNGSAPGHTTPASAPAGPLDRMHSTPTRPED
jgi:uncharacterized protein DUF2637